eukprot:gene814-138_t
MSRFMNRNQLREECKRRGLQPTTWDPKKLIQQLKELDLAETENMMTQTFDFGDEQKDDTEPKTAAGSPKTDAELKFMKEKRISVTASPKADTRGTNQRSSQDVVGINELEVELEPPNQSSYANEFPNASSAEIVEVTKYHPGTDPSINTGAEYFEIKPGHELVVTAKNNGVWTGYFLNDATKKQSCFPASHVRPKSSNDTYTTFEDEGSPATNVTDGMGGMFRASQALHEHEATISSTTDNYSPKSAASNGTGAKKPSPRKKNTQKTVQRNTVIDSSPSKPNIDDQQLALASSPQEFQELELGGMWRSDTQKVKEYSDLHNSSFRVDYETEPSKRRCNKCKIFTALVVLLAGAAVGVEYYFNFLGLFGEDESDGDNCENVVITTDFDGNDCDVLIGDLTVASDVSGDLVLDDFFPNLEQIQGDVNLFQTQLTSFAFQDSTNTGSSRSLLKKTKKNVLGSIKIKLNRLLRSINFDDVENIGGSVEIETNDALESVILSPQEYAVGIQGNIEIKHNRDLTVVELNGIDTIDGAFDCEENENLETIDMQNLKQCSSVIVSPEPDDFEIPDDLETDVQICSAIEFEGCQCNCIHINEETNERESEPCNNQDEIPCACDQNGIGSLNDMFQRVCTNAQCREFCDDRRVGQDWCKLTLEEFINNWGSTPEDYYFFCDEKMCDAMCHWPSLTLPTPGKVYISKKPTFYPTATPSFSPTFVPSAHPSFAPTGVPSHEPSASPTGAPSTSPSAMPSESPTYMPSASPTDEPSASPTYTPSVSPSPVPTHDPTTQPTGSPSVSPSHAPTGSPSHSPTSTPTESPSHVPTEIPTVNPTSSPTIEHLCECNFNRQDVNQLWCNLDGQGWNPVSGCPPGVDPCPVCTASPTPVPTDSPTESPTQAPTEAPTSAPTFTHSPTSSPSEVPSSVPSAAPTHVPSTQPTDVPSTSPTYSPSAVPSGSPTHVPSPSPTGSPVVPVFDAVNNLYIASADNVLDIFLSWSWPDNFDSATTTSLWGFHMILCLRTQPDWCAHRFYPLDDVYDPSTHPLPTAMICHDELTNTINEAAAGKPHAVPNQYWHGSQLPFLTYDDSLNIEVRPVSVEGVETNSKQGTVRYSEFNNDFHLDVCCSDTYTGNDCESIPTDICPISYDPPKKYDSLSKVACGWGSDYPGVASIPSFANINPHETFAPTSNPTSSPSARPSVTPTPNPTESPTAKPTPIPTQVPTNSPTEAPTNQPTPVPTEAPTTQPTEAPTTQPTEAPTTQPTEAPTTQPTESPTGDPTMPP